MKRAFGWGLAALFWGFAGMQFVHRMKPANPRAEPDRALFVQMQVEAPVRQVLERSCMDCHSNETRWPWYARVAPGSWWMIPKINAARSSLNFSDWGGYPESKQRELLKGICDQTMKGHAPLAEYEWVHREAKLGDRDVRALCEWTRRVGEHE